jgi:hypothetical protein
MNSATKNRLRAGGAQFERTIDAARRAAEARGVRANKLFNVELAECSKIKNRSRKRQSHRAHKDPGSALGLIGSAKLRWSHAEAQRIQRIDCVRMSPLRSQRLCESFLNDVFSVFDHPELLNYKSLDGAE